jgi:glutathione S-transferase
MDDGEPLVESGAILDEIDQMVGPARALVPANGASRRRVMQTTALAIASMEKVQWGYYERRFRPPEKVHEPWIEHNNGQALGGLKRLDAIAAALAPDAWLAGTDAISQADITAAVVVSWVREGRPELKLEVEAPSLCRFAERCEALPAFKAAPMPKSEVGRPGVYIPKVG